MLWMDPLLGTTSNESTELTTTLIWSLPYWTYLLHFLIGCVCCGSTRVLMNIFKLCWIGGWHLSLLAVSWSNSNYKCETFQHAEYHFLTRKALNAMLSIQYWKKIRTTITGLCICGRLPPPSVQHWVHHLNTHFMGGPTLTTSFFH